MCIRAFGDSWRRSNRHVDVLDGHLGDPKGAHCCVACTLAVYTVLEVGAIRYFDCAVLAQDVRRLVREGGRRFNKRIHPRMLTWALGSD